MVYTGHRRYTNIIRLIYLIERVACYLLTLVGLLGCLLLGHFRFILRAPREELLKSRMYFPFLIF